MMRKLSTKYFLLTQIYYNARSYYEPLLVFGFLRCSSADLSTMPFSDISKFDHI
jgi:hypothetical protein